MDNSCLKDVLKQGLISPSEWGEEREGRNAEGHRREGKGGNKGEMRHIQQLASKPHS
jgi:hypothetical protein